MQIKERLILLGKILFGLLGVIVFPIGLFILGYVIGQYRERNKLTPKIRTDTIIEEKSSEEREDSPEVLIV